MIRRSRTIEELLQDKTFPYHVGQLIGASEMVAHWMTIHGDEDTKQMGYKLAETVGWFFKEEGKSSRPTTRVSSEDDTMIMGTERQKSK